jgi:S1-C subfamily serine protease
MLVGTPIKTRPRLPIFWSPRDLDQPRYVLASSTSPSGISLHPVFVGSLAPITTPQWAGTVWALPIDAAVVPGALLFTEQGELVGVVAQYDAGLAVVPARMLLASAEGLLESPQKAPADLGIEVDTLTPQLATAAGAETGVVVAWVDPAGIAASMLRVGDVIQAANDTAITSVEQWRVRAARVGVGDTVTLRVIRRGAARTATLAIAATPEDSRAELGLEMRPAARVGTEITRVARGSAAYAAGIAPGDFITAIGSVNAPSPARVASAFAAIERGELLMVAIRRNGTHRVMVLQR